MRISFDLDGTLVRGDGDVPCEPRLAWPLRLFVSDQPLRLGAKRLAGELTRRGHELWIYTKSRVSPAHVRLWLRLHGIRVGRVITGFEHDKRFGRGNVPVKKPDAFGIDLHIDDSDEVRKAAEWYGYRAHIVDPVGEDWWRGVLDAVDRVEAELAAVNYEI